MSSTLSAPPVHSDLDLQATFALQRQAFAGNPSPPAAQRRQWLRFRPRQLQQSVAGKGVERAGGYARHRPDGCAPDATAVSFSTHSLEDMPSS